MQTVPYWIGTGTDLKYCLYNETTDHLTEFNGTANTVYYPPADDEEEVGEEEEESDGKGKDKGKGNGKYGKRWW